VSFRARLFAALTAAALLPLGLLAYGVRREMTRRLTDDSDRRAAAAVQGLRDGLARESAAIAARLDAMAADLERDNRFRLGVAPVGAGGGEGSRRDLLDLGEPMMRGAGLDFLEIQDSAGRIVSSGHFRNEFDRIDSLLPRGLAAAGTAPVLVRARTPTGEIVVLARLDSVRARRERFTVAGGATVEPRLRAELSRDPDLALSVVYPPAGDSTAERSSGTGEDSTAAGDSTADDRDRTVAELRLPFVDLTSGAHGSSAEARFVVTQSAATLRELRRSVDRWFLVALAVGVPLALAAAAWLAARISRPLTALAEQTAAIDFDRLDQTFPGDRDDEIGALAGVLGAMTERLRVGAQRLRDAERHVATGDLARQVNHDVKNGLVPIRNVLRHLSQVARDDPTSLPAVFAERRGTLESGLEYLETLARNYARLSPAMRREPCDVNAVVDEVVRVTDARPAALRATPAEGLPRVPADALALRRVLENLVGNAVDSLAGRSDGLVTVATEVVGPGARAVRLSVTDNGPGMSKPELERAFNDFHTTKEEGTGLGLSIVRRLVLDLGGSLRIETSPGAGTRAIVELPSYDGNAPDGGKPA
jgi:signal transduction histidine kinase